MNSKLTPRGVGTPALGLVDAIYLTPWVIGIIFLRNVHGLTVILLIPVFVASWWQDWRSARAAATYFAGHLAGFDALTAANYATLAISWQQQASRGMLLSAETLFHWAGIFAIYILWNLALVPGSDRSTRRMFIWFSVAELPLVVLAGLLTTAAISHHPPSRSIVIAGISILAAGHIGLLGMWRYISRRNPS
jgi:hypothetical protein